MREQRYGLDYSEGVGALMHCATADTIGMVLVYANIDKQTDIQIVITD